MSKYYLLLPDTQHEGVPEFLYAVLAESFRENNPMPEMDYSWTQSPLHIKINFPKELWLISKDMNLLFDYYPNFSGHIISKEFKRLLDDFLIYGFNEVPLKTISWKKQKVTNKEYLFIRFFEDVDCIDYDNSKFKKNKGKTNQEYGKRYGLNIEKFYNISLKENLKDLFATKDDLFYDHLFCSEKFKKEAVKRKMYGINFIPVDIAAEVFNDFYSV